MSSVPRPLLTVGRANRGDPNNWVTSCKVCRLGVFRDQPWLWSTNPLGIIHTRCREAS